MMSKPTKDELERRILQQMQWHQGSETVALIWHGYLTGIFEWGLLSIEDHATLINLLPKVGVKEVVEIFEGERLSPEREREIDRFVAGEQDTP